MEYIKLQKNQNSTENYSIDTIAQICSKIIRKKLRKLSSGKGWDTFLEEKLKDMLQMMLVERKIIDFMQICIICTCNFFTRIFLVKYLPHMDLWSNILEVHLS